MQLTAVDGLWNTSRFDIPKLLDDPDNIADNLRAYIAGFSPEAREILDRFEFASQITRLHKSGLLYLVLGKFAEIDLHPDQVSNLEMGYLYEELIRRFSELSNETAGEHFTPREVIRLMVNLLFIEDDDILSKPGAKATLFDPACGTGGMLSVAEDFVRSHNPQATLTVYGQELNSESYAICRSDMMLKGQNATNIKVGNSLKAYDPEDPGDQGDQHPNERFDYLLANPPFGVEWKKVADSVKHEHETKGFAGRYGAGLPRINDGSFLFLQHMISKMRPPEQGGHAWRSCSTAPRCSPARPAAARARSDAGSSRTTGSRPWSPCPISSSTTPASPPTSGSSPTARAATARARCSSSTPGRASPRCARASVRSARRSATEQIADIVRLYGNFDQQLSDDDEQRVKIFPNEEFGFLRITVERPLRLKWEVTDASADALLADKKLAKLDEQQRQALVEHARGHVRGTGTTFDSEAAARKEAKRWMADLHLDGKPIENAIVDALAVRDPDADPITDKHGHPEPDPDLRDNENVPLPNEPVRYEPDPTDRLATDTYRKAVEQYVEQEVHPYVPDAWIDHTKTKIGYEIPLTRHFYVYTPPRPLEEIDAEIKQLEAEIQELLREVTE